MRNDNMIYEPIYHLAGVQAFHVKFGVPIEDRPIIMEVNVFMFRFEFLHEELQELLRAYRAQDIVAFADALLDIEYVLHGTALMSGLGSIWHDLWIEVQRANMAKVRATSTNTPRRSLLDVIKPPGWIPPTQAQARIIGRAIDESH